MVWLFKIISGAVNGQVKFWDPRVGEESLFTILAHTSAMTALAVHDYAPVLAR
jgi:regulator-associated protein of mTOR